MTNNRCLNEPQGTIIIILVLKLPPRVETWHQLFEPPKPPQQLDKALERVPILGFPGFTIRYLGVSKDGEVNLNGEHDEKPMGGIVFFPWEQRPEVA